MAGYALDGLIIAVFILNLRPAGERVRRTAVKCERMERQIAIKRHRLQVAGSSPRSRNLVHERLGEGDDDHRNAGGLRRHARSCWGVLRATGRVIVGKFQKCRPKKMPGLVHKFTGSTSYIARSLPTHRLSTNLIKSCGPEHVAIPSGYRIVSEKYLRSMQLIAIRPYCQWPRIVPES